jgi:hypothetical protein
MDFAHLLVTKQQAWPQTGGWYLPRLKSLLE